MPGSLFPTAFWAGRGAWLGPSCETRLACPSCCTQSQQGLVDFRGSSDGSGSESRRQEDIVASIMEKVKEIKAELGGTERKLAEGLGHSREIGRLLGLVELVGDNSEWLGDLDSQFRIST